MARTLLIAILFVAVMFVEVLAGQPKYTGPHPPKKDVPYLVHAGNPVETEAGTAFQIINNDLITYVISGEKSTARTPLASPIFVIESDDITDVEKLRLFRLEAQDGHRTVTFHRKGLRGAMPLKIEIKPISGDLFQIEVADSLPPGQYALTPDGANQVFCFEVF
jgi:hypothetical protein